jgi:hypothetical protein
MISKNDVQCRTGVVNGYYSNESVMSNDQSWDATPNTMVM